MFYLCSVLLYYYTTMVTLSNITFRYPSNPIDVVHDFSLDIRQGGIYGLLGANGTGKSTLLYLISGLLHPQQGTATTLGHEASQRQPSMLADIFLVPEEIDLPSCSLKEYVKVNAPFYPRFSQTQLEEYLEMFRLTPDLHLGKLSMGQKKKAFVAFALACNTRLLLMDEPTNGLDIPGKNEFRRAIVSGQNDERITIISTHQVRDLDRVLDHITIVSKEGVVLNSDIASLQNRLQFLFTNDPSDCQGALWSIPVPGGYNIIRTRVNPDDPTTETDVNIESLFEFAFSNPLMAQSL